MTHLSFAFLLTYLSVVYIRPHEIFKPDQSWPILPILLLLVLLTSLAGSGRNPKAPQAAASIGLLVAASASVALSGWLGGALYANLDLIVSLLVLYCISASVVSIRQMKIVLALIVLIGCVFALHGIDQSASGIGWSGAFPVQDGRITYIGFMNDPNDLSRIFIFCAPIALFFCAQGGMAARMLGSTALVLVLVGTFLTSSRGAYLALISMSAVVMIHRFGALRASIALPFVIVGMLYFASDRMSDISTEEASAAGRVDAWYAGIEMLRSHPLFGVGKGSFTEFHTLTAHNSFVLAFAEMGLFGYFFWFALIYSTFRMLLDLLRSPVGGLDTDIISAPLHPFLKENRQLIHALFAANAGLMVTAMFLSRTYELTMYVGIGLVMAMYQIALRKGVPNLTTTRLWPLVPRLVLYTLVSIFAIWLLVRVLLLAN